MARKDKNRPAKPLREIPQDEPTAAVSSLIIRPVQGNRPLLIASLILLLTWLAILSWLAWLR